MAGQQAQDIDVHIVDDVRNFLFGPPGAGGFDLASLNIQRGRDHGLPTLAEAREDLGLPAIESFDDIANDPAVSDALASVYESPRDVDLWIGGLAEDHVAGSQLGMTFHAIVVTQFVRLRDGDRFYYERLPSTLRMLAHHTKLSTVIRRNTEASISDLRHEVMQLDQPAANETLGFESSRRWRASGASIATNRAYRTDGAASLNVSSDRRATLTSNDRVSASMFVGVETILLDVFVPERDDKGGDRDRDRRSRDRDPLVQVLLSCSDVDVQNDVVGRYDLSLVPRGQFNTAEMTIDSRVQERLASRPGASCRIKVVLDTDTRDPFALDRLRVR
jgi:hypothetical protein